MFDMAENWGEYVLKKILLWGFQVQRKGYIGRIELKLRRHPEIFRVARGVQKPNALSAEWRNSQSNGRLEGLYKQTGYFRFLLFQELCNVSVVNLADSNCNQGADVMMLLHLKGS